MFDHLIGFLARRLLRRISRDEQTAEPLTPEVAEKIQPYRAEIQQLLKEGAKTPEVCEVISAKTGSTPGQVLGFLLAWDREIQEKMISAQGILQPETIRRLRGHELAFRSRLKAGEALQAIADEVAPRLGVMPEQVKLYLAKIAARERAS